MVCTFESQDGVADEVREIAVDDAGAGYASMRHILEIRPAFAKLDISLVRGPHQIQFGMNYLRPVQNATINFNSAGSFTFDGSVTGLSMADFLIGAPYDYYQYPAAPSNIRSKNTGGSHEYPHLHQESDGHSTPGVYRQLFRELQYRPYFGYIVIFGTDNQEIGQGTGQ